MSALESINGSNRERLFELILESLSIRSHLEFFVWMQLGVGEFLTHDALIASWGDFEKDELLFDICSSLPGVRTGKSANRPDLVPFVKGIQSKWSKLGRSSFYFSRDSGDGDEVKEFPQLDTHDLADARSFLVHGVRDQRDMIDCLYIFVSYKKDYNEKSQYICDILMPHVDAALRRIDALPSSPHEESVQIVCPSTYEELGISDREQEVLQWVCIGKTNPEIGMILGISANTVKNHLKRIFEKLNVSNRAQAVAKIASTT